MQTYFAREPSRRLLACALGLLLAVVAGLYLPYLNNPIVFDDFNFFGAPHPEIVEQVFSLDLRWMPNASFEWPRRLIEQDLPWQRLINLALHSANTLLLCALLRRLLAVGGPGRPGALAPAWIAFFAAALFALHPAAVYAVGYLVQRTSLMAGLFTLAMWLLLASGLQRESSVRLLLSALAYAGAVLCKEHAIMAPAVAACIVVLHARRGPPGRGMWLAVLAAFVLYACAALYVVWQVKSVNILGEAYQANGQAMLQEYARRDPGFDPAQAYPLSVLTQSCLYFKYWLVWLLPGPGWMSVDMHEAFALRLLSWRLLGAAAFAAWPMAGLWLLWRRDRRALAGLAMLAPWLMFMTEVSTVRIQEIFVLYRSYLWMPLAALAAPLLLSRLPARVAAGVLLLACAAFVPLSWQRLATFSDDWRLWDDAARLVVEGVEYQGAERIYKNRGLASLNRKDYEAAIRDNDVAVRLSPNDFIARNNRGVTYYEMGRYHDAVRDFNKALELHPEYGRSYLGRARALEALGNLPAAQADYAKACEYDMPEICP